jgi:hypothetical protein
VNCKSNVSKHLVLSQMMILKETCKSHNAHLYIIHKFLFFIDKNKEKYYVKINMSDNEFYLFSKTHFIQIFKSFEELSKWIQLNVLKKDDKSVS